MTRRRTPVLAAVALALGLTGAVAPAVASTPIASTPIAGRSAADAVMLGDSAPVGNAPYRFSAKLDGRPVRWNPCTPIHWQFTPGGGPRGGFGVVTRAVNRVSAVTGTRWVLDGIVGSAPTTRWLPNSPAASRPVLIGWSDAAHSDLLSGQPRLVLGVTRTAWFGTDDHRGHRVAAMRAAVIALDRTDRLPLTGGASWRSVVLHELGHTMDLDHVADGRQLMSAVLPRGAADYAAGDLAGLSRLGRQAGCVNVP